MALVFNELAIYNANFVWIPNELAKIVLMGGPVRWKVTQVLQVGGSLALGTLLGGRFPDLGLTAEWNSPKDWATTYMHVCAT